MRLAQLLPVIAVIGSSPGVRAVPQGPPIYREGAYHSYVKSSSPTADSSFDARALVQALRDTGHDIVGFICDDGEFGDDESGTFWKAFRDLLDASQDKIEVFAVLRERHLVAASRWDYDWLRAALNSRLSPSSIQAP